MRKFLFGIIKYRLLLVCIYVLISLLSAYELRNIKINSDVTTYLPAEDAYVSLYNYIGKEYSASFTAIVILESDDVFTATNIEEIHEITSAINLTEGVDFVISLTSVLDIRTDEWGFEIGRLIDEFSLPETEEEVRKLKEYTLSKDLYRGHLISEDSKYTLIICQLSESSDKSSVAKEIRQTVNDLDISQKLYFDGIPFQVVSIMDFIVQDLMLLTPLIVLVILIMLYFAFRSMKWVLLPIASVGMGILWTMAIMSLSGTELTPISDALPVVLFAVGSAYGIHVVNKIRYNRIAAEGENESLVMSVMDVSKGVILAGLTTFVGFISFVFSSYLVIVRDFGIFSALGIIIILFISLTFIPAVSSWYKDDKKTRNKKDGRRSGFPDNILKYFPAFVNGQSKLIVSLSIVLTIIGIGFIPQINRKVDILEYFKESSDLRQSARIMNTRFGGSLPVIAVVNGDVFEPSTLERLKVIAEHFNSIEGVSNSRSIANYFMQMNEAMGEGYELPDSREKIQNLWFMIESEESMQQFVNYDMNQALVYASMQNLDAKNVHRINDNINEFIETLSSEEVSQEVTGMQAIYSKLDDSMLKNLLQSMLLAFVFVFITMIFLIGSFKGAVAGISSLAFSMLLVLGFMGISGIALDIATILIAGVTIGIGIDYSIHFTTACRKFVNQGYDIRSAIEKTLLSTGRAIIINVFTVMTGFLVLVFANLIPLQQFGILIAVSMFCAGISSLTLLPVLISGFMNKKNNKK